MRARRFFSNRARPVSAGRIKSDTLEKFPMRFRGEPGRGRAIAIVHSGCEDRVRMNPLAGRRFAIRRRTLQAQRPTGAGQFHYFNLPAGDLAMATLADADVIARMPEMKLVETAKQIDLVFGRPSQWGEPAHEQRMASGRETNNQGANCRAYRSKPDSARINPIQKTFTWRCPFGERRGWPARATKSFCAQLGRAVILPPGIVT